MKPRFFSNPFARVVALAWLACSAGAALAQSPVPLPTPNQPLLTSGTVLQGQPLADGRRVIRGSFSWVNGEPNSGRLRRLLPGGEVDSAWNPPTYTSLGEFAADSAGNVYAHVHPNRIVKLSATDGAEVSGFQAQANNVTAIRIDGSFLYGLGSWTLNGVARVTLVRMSMETGAIEPAYSNDLGNVSTNGFGFDAQGRAYVGHSAGVSRILQDGTLDAGWSVIGVGSARHPVVAGDSLFVSASAGNGNERVYRIGTANGAIDPQFSALLAGEVRALYVDGDGGVWAGGSFSSLNGSPVASNGLLRLRADGSLDVQRTPDCDCTLYAIQAGHGAATLELYGVVHAIDSATRLGLARITDTGGLLASIGSAESLGSGRTLLALADGRALVGGQFSKVGSHVTRNVARLHSDGNTDTDFVSATATSASALSISPIDGAIFVGGFGTVNGGQLAKLDSKTGATISEWVADVSSPGVRTLSAAADGFLYIGGSFSQVNGVSRPHFARISQGGAGALDTSWALSPAPGPTYAVVIDESGFLYVTRFDRIARYAAAGAISWESNVRNVASRLMLRGNRLLTSGSHCAGAAPDQRCGVVAFDATNGLLESSWSFGPQQQTQAGEILVATGMGPAPNGELLVSGYFLHVTSNATRGYVWRVAADSGNQVAPGWQPRLDVASAVSALSTGRALVAGTFTEVSGIPRFGIASLPIPMQDGGLFANGFE